jgi:hypothetical protein
MIVKERKILQGKLLLTKSHKSGELLIRGECAATMQWPERSNRADSKSNPANIVVP